MAVAEETVPEFAHAMRGYDRYQVDEYVERLNEWAAGAQRRAEDAERRAGEAESRSSELQQRLRDAESQTPAVPDRVLEDAATRAAAALNDALTESGNLRRQGREAAERIIADARSEASSVVESAHIGVAELAEAARQARRAATARIDELVGETEATCAGRLSDAEARAAELVAAGEAEAQRLVSAAEGRAEVARQRSDEAQRQAELRLAHLRAEREQIVGELRRLRGAIKSLIVEPTPVEGVPVADALPVEQIAPVATGAGPGGVAASGQTIDLTETRLDIPVQGGAGR